MWRAPRSAPLRLKISQVPGELAKPDRLGWVQPRPATRVELRRPGLSELMDDRLQSVIHKLPMRKSVKSVGTQKSSGSAPPGHELRAVLGAEAEPERMGGV